MALPSQRDHSADRRPLIQTQSLSSWLDLKYSFEYRSDILDRDCAGCRSPSELRCHNTNVYIDGHRCSWQIVDSEPIQMMSSIRFENCATAESNTPYTQSRNTRTAWQYYSAVSKCYPCGLGYPLTAHKHTTDCTNYTSLAGFSISRDVTLATIDTVAPMWPK